MYLYLSTCKRHNETWVVCLRSLTVTKLEGELWEVSKTIYSFCPCFCVDAFSDPFINFTSVYLSFYFEHLWDSDAFLFVFVSTDNSSPPPIPPPPDTLFRQSLENTQTIEIHLPLPWTRLFGPKIADLCFLKLKKNPVSLAIRDLVDSLSWRLLENYLKYFCWSSPHS